MIEALGQSPALTERKQIPLLRDPAPRIAMTWKGLSKSQGLFLFHSFFSCFIRLTAVPKAGWQCGLLTWSRHVCRTSGPISGLLTLCPWEKSTGTVAQALHTHLLRPCRGEECTTSPLRGQPSPATQLPLGASAGADRQIPPLFPAGLSSLSQPGSWAWL